MNNFEFITKEFVDNTLRKINLDVMAKHAMSIQTELNVKIKENSNLLDEIEKLEAVISQQLLNRMRIVEEINEKKSRVTLIKKEIEIKRHHIKSMINSEKDLLDQKDRHKQEKLFSMIQSINNRSQAINELATNLDLAQLLFIEEEKLIQNFIN